MFEDLANIDWKSLDAPEIPVLVQAVASQHEEERSAAFVALRKYFVPWQLMEGYANEWHWQHLDKLMTNRVPNLTVPFLIEVLKRSSNPSDKVALLGILYDLCRYAELPDIYQMPPNSDERHNLQTWGMNLRELTRAGTGIFRTLLFDQEPDIRKEANLLLGTLGDEYFIEAWSS